MHDASATTVERCPFAPPLACPMAQRDTTHNPYLHSHDERSVCAGADSGSARHTRTVGASASAACYRFGSCQSIAGLPAACSAALIFEKGLLPKKPLRADNGEGCADWTMI